MTIAGRPAGKKVGHQRHDIDDVFPLPDGRYAYSVVTPRRHLASRAERRRLRKRR
ncbi:MAG: hypothetical protein ACI9MR_000710 [Myxococcota bacterium]|jgi:hypothetical protein